MTLDFRATRYELLPWQLNGDVGGLELVRMLGSAKLTTSLHLSCNILGT